MQRLDKIRALLDNDTAVYISKRANVYYYSLYNSDDISLLISKDRAVLITDSRYTYQAKLKCPDYEIFDVKNGIENLFSEFSEAKIGFEEEDLTVKRLERLKEKAKKDFVPMGDTIEKPREIKEEIEIAKIKTAEELGDRAFSYVLENLKAGMTEKEVAFLLEFYLRKQGAERLSFETIVASGKRSAMPHGVASDKIIEKGDMVTFDFGCVIDGYCSDMTRTVHMGAATAEEKLVYDTVLKAQIASLNAIETGKSLKDIDKAARDIIANAGYGEYFGHSLGHSVGIEIHENPNFSPRAEGMVQNGQVISVEPGIYLDGKFGVRIEDLVVISEEKAVVLSKSPKELILI
ncbi:MAG: aminopeptidase P family protein [Clostridia bacterium]|nr:aminopeptidase P family protein [Clostridia bacterium]